MAAVPAPAPRAARVSDARFCRRGRRAGPLDVAAEPDGRGGGARAGRARRPPACPVGGTPVGRARPHCVLHGALRTGCWFVARVDVGDAPVVDAAAAPAFRPRGRPGRVRPRRAAGRPLVFVPLGSCLGVGRRRSASTSAMSAVRRSRARPCRAATPCPGAAARHRKRCRRARTGRRRPRLAAAASRRVTDGWPDNSTPSAAALRSAPGARDPRAPARRAARRLLRSRASLRQPGRSAQRPRHRLQPDARRRLSRLRPDMRDDAARVASPRGADPVACGARSSARVDPRILRYAAMPASAGPRRRRRHRLS